MSSRSFLAVVVGDNREYEKIFIKGAISLGCKLSTKVHLLVPKEHEQWIISEVHSLMARELHTKTTIVVHFYSESHSVSMIAEGMRLLEQFQCDFVLMQDPGERIKFELLARIEKPILVIPNGLDLTAETIRSILVPMSGEEQKSDALEFAMSLAELLRSPIDLIHVSTKDHTCRCSEFEMLVDHVYYEWEAFREKIVANASPFSTNLQRSLVRDFFHATGDTPDEIIKLLVERPGTILVVEWKGVLVTGHANTLKTLMHTKHTAIFLIKTKHPVAYRGRIRLKVGSDFEAA